MTDDDISKLKKRFAELAERAERSFIYQETRFLDQAEQSVLLSMRLPIPITLYGGFDNAERRIACFGSEEIMGYAYEPPIVCVNIQPKGARFAEELTHRDFLGSLMGLGFTRDVLGDIVVHNGEGWLFCLGTAAPVIIEELVKVRHTCVICSEGVMPQDAVSLGETRSFTVPSERLDALISAVYKLSRDESKKLCEKGLVYVNSRLCLKAGSTPEAGDMVSVRGHGRFRFLRIENETRKGRLRVLAEVF